MGSCCQPCTLVEQCSAFLLGHVAPPQGFFEKRYNFPETGVPKLGTRVEFTLDKVARRFGAVCFNDVCANLFQQPILFTGGDSIYESIVSS